MDEILQEPSARTVQRTASVLRRIVNALVDTNHGAFTIGTHVIHLVVFVGGGLLFGFAIVMPGIAKLNDTAYLLAFKHMDGIIKTPALHLGLGWFNALRHGHPHSGNDEPQWNRMYLLVFAVVLYFVGVQWPTLNQYSPQQLGPGVGS